MALPLFAQESDNDEYLRLNPQIEISEDCSIDYSAYRFLKLNNNTINLNGDDWAPLVEKFRAAREKRGVFNVVYLGDSHVQADFGGSILRQRLINASHSAGRGLIIPFRIAGTNQPTDYHIGISCDVISSKLMRTPWPTEMPFTGIGIQPQNLSHTLTFGSSFPTSRIVFHTRGPLPQPISVSADNTDVGFMTGIDDNGLQYIDIARPATEFSITLDSGSTTVYGGIELIADSVGTQVHSIGNNGATFSSYATVDHFGSELATLSPDLVIIALGTNEAFGRTSVASIQNDADVLISSILTHSPQAKILLIGPTECYRKIYRRRNGRRRSSTVLNTRAAEMARAIRLYAEDRQIAYYNHFAVAGSAVRMRSTNILSRDGVHFTATGYRLWGNLLSDALLKELQR